MAENDRRLGPLVEGWRPPDWPSDGPMEGRFVRLERLSVAHGEALWAAMAGDDALWTYMGQGPFEQLAAFCDWIASVQTGADPLFFALIERASDRALGFASYLRITPAMGSVEVGNIVFARALQRGPAATEAMALMMARVFGQGYRRYEWKCNAFNLPSRRAAQRLGFSFEGVFRQHMVVKGRNRDTAWFAVTDTDWPALKAAYRVWLAPENFDSEGRQRRRLSEMTAGALAARDPALA